MKRQIKLDTVIEEELPDIVLKAIENDSIIEF